MSLAACWPVSLSFEIYLYMSFYIYIYISTLAFCLLAWAAAEMMPTSLASIEFSLSRVARPLTLLRLLTLPLWRGA